jgi:hypothetical protein
MLQLRTYEPYICSFALDSIIVFYHKLQASFPLEDMAEACNPPLEAMAEAYNLPLEVVVEAACNLLLEAMVEACTLPSMDKAYYSTFLEGTFLHPFQAFAGTLETSGYLLPRNWNLHNLCNHSCVRSQIVPPFIVTLKNLSFNI